MSRNKNQAVYNESQDQESRRSRSRSRDRSRDRDRDGSRDGSRSQQSSERYDEQQQDMEEMNFMQSNRTSRKNQEITAQNVATELRSIILDFFGKVKYQKGFVFTPQDRTKMINEQKKLSNQNKNHKKIHWNQECIWEIQEETNKIDKIFGEDYRGLDKPTLKLIKGIFLNTSYLFGNETTDELYQILLNILNIVLDNLQNSQEGVKEFMSFLLRDNTQFIFFNYKFSKNYKPKTDPRTTEQIYHEFGVLIFKELKRALITI